LNFSLTSFRPHYGPRVDSVSKRNEYQEYFLGGKGGRCVGLTILPPSCADCLEIWVPQSPGTLRPSPGLSWYFFFYEFYDGWLRTARNWALAIVLLDQQMYQKRSALVQTRRFDIWRSTVRTSVSLSLWSRLLSGWRGFASQTAAVGP